MQQHVQATRGPCCPPYSHIPKTTMQFCKPSIFTSSLFASSKYSRIGKCIPIPNLQPIDFQISQVCEPPKPYPRLPTTELHRCWYCTALYFVHPVLIHPKGPTTIWYKNDIPKKVCQLQYQCVHSCLFTLPRYLAVLYAGTGTMMLNEHDGTGTTDNYTTCYNGVLPQQEAGNVLDNFKLSTNGICVMT